MTRLVVAAVFLFVESIYAIPHSRVLLPIYSANPVPGAFESRWISELAIYNPSGRELRIAADQRCTFDSCTPIGDEDARVMPGETQWSLPSRYPDMNGRGAVVYIAHPETVPDNMSVAAFQLRVKDLSRQDQSAGTEIPVVRESAFRTATIRLLSVPVGARFRSTIRIYEMNLADARFVLRVFDEETNALISIRTVEATRTSSQAEFEYHFEPAYAQVSDIVAASTSRIRVEIQPVTAGSLFWAFVSITNNDTQEFTVISPQ